MADVVNTNQFKNRMHIGTDGSAWRIVEFQHVKPGKGAFVRTKLKNLDSGPVVGKTFRAGEKFPRVITETKNVLQYLYDSGDEVVFMDEQTFEQISLSRESVSEALDFLRPSSTVQLMTVDGQPLRRSAAGLG